MNLVLRINISIMVCTSVDPCGWVRASEYLDKNLPFMQESWVTIGTQVPGA